MNPLIGKTLASLYFMNPTTLHKPPIQYSISLLRYYYYSSSTVPKKAKTITPLADYLINHHQFSPEAALKASSIKPHMKKPENAVSVLSFLRECGFSQTHIEFVVKREPNVLFANFDNQIKLKIAIFQSFGFPSTDIVDILSADPWIFTGRPDKELESSILVLKNILGSIECVSKLLKVSGWFLRCDLNKTLVPNIEFLKSCGISTSQIVTYLFHFPRFFLYKPESLKNFVKRVDELGFDRKSKMYLQAIRTMSSMTIENWELKLKVFGGLGFSEDNILSMFWRLPQVFVASEKKIRGATEILHSRGKLDNSFIVNSPCLLLCSIEHKLKPWLEVLEILESKKLLHKRGSLVAILAMPKKKFLDKYVLPYSDELGELSVSLMTNSQ